MVYVQQDSRLREVLLQVEPVDTVGLLTWFFSTTDNPAPAPTCSMGEVLATALEPRVEAFVDNTTPGFKSSHAPLPVASPVSTSIPALQAHTLLPLAPLCLTLKPLALQSVSHPSHSLSVANPRSITAPQIVYLMTNVTRGLASESW